MLFARFVFFPTVLKLWNSSPLWTHIFGGGAKPEVDHVGEMYQDLGKEIVSYQVGEAGDDSWGFGKTGCYF